MLTLVKATQLSRLTLKWGTISLGIFLIFFFIVQAILYVSRLMNPPLPPTAEETFGFLPEVTFPTYNQPLTYSLNTVTGTLPVFPDRIKVYKIVKKDPQLLDLKNAREKLSHVGFFGSETKIQETLYQWSTVIEPQTFILYNIITNAFQIHSNILDNPQLLEAKRLPKDQDAQDVALSFLRSVDESTKGFDLTKTKYTYFNIQDKKLLQVDAFNEAQVIKVDLYQKLVNNLEIFYPNYLNESIIKFWIASNKYLPIIVYANFRHQETDETNPLFSSTYLIKSTAEAFQDLKNGNAYIFNPTNKQNIEITDISLGYYVDNRIVQQPEQDYLIPIMVFKGRDFKAYVHALFDSRFKKGN